MSLFAAQEITITMIESPLLEHALIEHLLEGFVANFPQPEKMDFR